MDGVDAGTNIIAGKNLVLVYFRASRADFAPEDTLIKNWSLGRDIREVEGAPFSRTF